MSHLAAAGGNIEWFLEPLCFCALLIVGLGLCVYLFLSLKAELYNAGRRRRKAQSQVEAVENTLGELRLRVQTLETELRDCEQQTGMLVPPAAAPSGLNLSKRTQVLRLDRAGQDSSVIASALGLPRHEVELLIKVHRIVLEQVTPSIAT